MSNIGYATLSVIPSLRGATAALQGEAGAVGTQAATAFGGGFNRVLSGGLIAAGVVAATGAALIAIGGQFDDAYDTIQTGTGATGDALEGLKDVFRDVVADVPTDFASAADAISLLNQRLELTGGPLEALSEQFLELSRITDTDLRGNIDSVTRAFGDWSVSTEDQSEALDRFFRASQSSGVAVSDLAEGVVQFGSPLRQLGFSLDESIALFASFGEAGVNTSTVMSGMRQSVKNFASGLAESELGVSNFGDVLAGVRDGTFSLSDAMTLFGTRAGPDMFAAIQEGRFQLDDFLGAMRGTEGGIMDTAAATMDWQESLTLLKNNLLLLLEGPATALMGWVSDVAAGFASLVAVFQADGISGVIERLQENFANLSPNMQAVAIGAGVLAVALLAVGIAAAVSALGFLAIPLAIAALAAGLVYAYQRFEGFRQVVDSVVAWITGTAIPAIVAFGQFVRDAFASVDWAGVWTTIVTAVTNAFNTIQTVVSTVISVVQGLWSVFGSTIISLAQTAWGTITGIIQNAINIILGIWNVLAGVFTGDWSRVWNGLVQVVSAVWDQMISLVESAWQALGALVRLGLTGLRALWDAGWEAVKSVVRAAWEGIKSAVSAGISAVVSFLTALPGRAVSAIASLVSGLTNKGREAMQGLLNAVRSVGETVVGFFRNLPNRIVSAIGSVGSLLVGVGRSIMEGLLSGIQSGAGAILDTVRGIASDIAGAISSVLGIFSPSRVMMELGEYTMEGLEVGMRAGWQQIAQWLSTLDPGTTLFGDDPWGSIFDLDLPSLTADRVILDIQDGWRGLWAMFNDMPFGFHAGTQAGNAFVRAIQDQASQIRNYVDALVDAGDFDGASAALTRMVNALRDIALASGMSAAAVDALINSLFGTLNLDDLVQVVEDDVERVNTLVAERNAVSSRYSGQTAETRVVVEANGVDSALVEWLRRSVRVESGGNVQAFLGA